MVLRHSNLSESLVSGSILSYSSSVSLSDDFHIVRDEELDIGNNALLSRSFDDLIMDIFFILDNRIPCPFLLCCCLQVEGYEDKEKVISIEHIFSPKISYPEYMILLWIVLSSVP